MPGFGNSNEEDQDNTFDEVSAMADRLGLQGQKRAAYIDDHMQGLGYQAVQSRESYVRPTREDDPGQGTGFGKRWGFGQSQQGGGSGGGGNRGGNRRDDGDSF